MPPRKKRALGRGMAELVEGSFSSMIEPAVASVPSKPAPTQQPSTPAPITAPITAPPASHPDTTRPFDVVSIASGKGGTGKSVLASNLAVLLAPTMRVTLLDADLGLANVHILFNLLPRYNVSHVITGERTLEEILIPGPRGVSLIPGGSGIPELANLTQGRFESLVRGIAALDRTTDLLLIDTPSGIDRQSLTFLVASDQVIVITTEDVTAMTDAYAVIKTVMTRRGDAAVALVVNQARSYADGVATFNKVAHVTRKFLGRQLDLGGVIPFDESVERSVAVRSPVSQSYPGSPACRAMASIAARIGAFHDRPNRAAQPFTSRLRSLIAVQPVVGP